VHFDRHSERGENSGSLQHPLLISCDSAVRTLTRTTPQDWHSTASTRGWVVIQPCMARSSGACYAITTGPWCRRLAPVSLVPITTVFARENVPCSKSRYTDQKESTGAHNARLRLWPQPQGHTLPSNTYPSSVCCRPRVGHCPLRLYYQLFSRIVHSDSIYASCTSSATKSSRVLRWHAELKLLD